jgi:hypothetical protein
VAGCFFQRCALLRQNILCLHFSEAADISTASTVLLQASQPICLDTLVCSEASTKAESSTLALAGWSTCLVVCLDLLVNSKVAR